MNKVLFYYYYYYYYYLEYKILNLKTYAIFQLKTAFSAWKVADLKRQKRAEKSGSCGVVYMVTLGATEDIAKQITF